MKQTNPRAKARLLRQKRVRRRVRGSESRPRLCVFRSGKHIYAQIISDNNGKTIAAVSTLSSGISSEATKKSSTVAAAKEVGMLMARVCQEKGIHEVVFDRNGFLFHGKVRALAEGAREAGLKF